MKLDAITRFDIPAEAFRIMTGHMAPGKSASMLSYPAPYEEREAAYAEWVAAHGECIRALLLAVERILPDEEATHG